MCLLESLIDRYLAANGKNRVSFRGGRCQAGDKVGDARARSGDTNANFASNTSESSRHERGILFVAAQNELDVRVLEGDEQRVDFGTWDAKSMGDAVGFENFDDCLRAIELLSCHYSVR